MQHIAIYLRVSSGKQDTRSQEPDLLRWVKAYADGQTVKWYRDKQSGTTMQRPGWQDLEADIATGAAKKLVVWRLDRLGRTAAGLTALFEDLQRRGVGFESVMDRIDLETASGRLMATVLSGVAAYENEIRSERIIAGQAAARAQGKKWGGSKRGVRKTVTDDQIDAVHKLYSSGQSKSFIARAVGLSRPTIYSLLSGD